MYKETLLTTLFAGLAAGHTILYGLWVNGQDQGDGRSKYIRTPPNNSRKCSPAWSPAVVFRVR